MSRLQLIITLVYLAVFVWFIFAPIDYAIFDMYDYSENIKLVLAAGGPFTFLCIALPMMVLDPPRSPI